ncbi:hypothetical protein [Helicobacter bilis]|nr:hypothetical protein [Helicobacter bilis]
MIKTYYVSFFATCHTESLLLVILSVAKYLKFITERNNGIL